VLAGTSAFGLPSKQMIVGVWTDTAWCTVRSIQECCHWLLIIVFIDRSPCGCEIRPSPKRTIEPRASAQADLASTASSTDYGSSKTLPKSGRQDALFLNYCCLPDTMENNGLALGDDVLRSHGRTVLLGRLQQYILSREMASSS